MGTPTQGSSSLVTYDRNLVMFYRLGLTAIFCFSKLFAILLGISISMLLDASHSRSVGPRVPVCRRYVVTPARIK